MNNNTWMGYLQEAMNSRGQEMLIAPESVPRVRRARHWSALNGEILTPQQTREWLTSFLSEEEKKSLQEKGVVGGSLKSQGRAIRYSVSVASRGLCGHFQWMNNEVYTITDWGFPQGLIEILRRGSGLSLIMGSRRSGKTSALATFLREIVNGRSLLVSIYSDRDELPEPEGAQMILSYDTQLLLQDKAPARSSDLVIIDSENIKALEAAVELSEAGVNVLCTLSAASLRAGIERLAEKLEGAPERGLLRLSHSLQWAVALRLVPGLEGKLQSVFECLAGTSSIRQCLREGRWEQIEAAMKTMGEKTGMRTMNQSLLQHILKRKIELRVGFEESPQPDELDQLLNKIGV